MRAVVDTGAAQVMVLPNGYVAAEELVAGCTAAIGWGIDVVPIPTGSMVQGLAALAVHEPDRQAVDDGYTMARAAGAARHGSVRIATESALTWAGRCRPGDGLGIAGDEVLIVAADAVGAAIGLLDLLLASGGDLVTVLLGAGIDTRRRRRRRRRHPGRTHARPPPRDRTGHLPHRPSRRRAADRGRVAMVSLSDRLDFVVGAKAADPLDEVFGIRDRRRPVAPLPAQLHRGRDTVGRRGRAARNGRARHHHRHDRRHRDVSDEEEPEQDVPPHHPRIRAEQGDRHVLQRELHQKGPHQGHQGDAVRARSGSSRTSCSSRTRRSSSLDSPDGRNRGTRSLKNIANASGATSGEELMDVYERHFFPIYPASTKLQSWDIFSCVRQVLDVLDPVPDPLPEDLRAKLGLVSEDEALRDIHLAESEPRRQRARERLTFDEAVGLQWALVARRHGELSESGPPAPPRPDGLAAELLGRLPFELTAGQREVLGVLSDGLAATRPLNRLLQGEVGSGKTIVSVLAMLQMVDAGYQCALLAPTEVLAAQHLRSIRDVLGPLAMAGQLGGADNGHPVGAAHRLDDRRAEETDPRRDRRRSGRHRRRHPRAAAGRGGVRQPGHGGGRRATPLRCRAARSIAGQGPSRGDTAPAGDDGDADSAHRRAHRVRRPGNLDAARTSARPPADHQQCHLRQGQARVAGPGLAAHHRGGSRRPPGLRGGAAHRRERRPG